MYVKAGINTGDKDVMNGSKNALETKELRIEGNGDANGTKQGNLMMRRLNSNERLSASFNSLDFLHRPQRVKLMDNSLYSEEEIKKNTNLNKALSKGASDRDYKNQDKGVSPTSLARVNNMLNTSGDENMFPLSPIYKKSGELVKSSLKRRSKSLPTSPHISNEHKNFAALRPGGRLQRSKSVHFDQKTPVKYFREDASPIDVSTKTQEETEEISFRHKPVRCLFDDDEDEEDFNDSKVLSMRIDSMNLGATSASSNSLPTANKEKNLRKSKRFSSMVKENPKVCSGPSSNPTNGHSGSVVGLYNANFAILSNKNPKSLKLNIFVNLSQDKKCFLQDITLYASKDQSSSLVKNHTRMIVGRVLVKNIYFDKKVVIKYTWNNWRTTQDLECVYVSDGDGILPGTNMDIFKFIIDDVNKQDSKAKLEFCIHYVTRNDFQRSEFWDNNNGKNYKIDCIMDGFNNPFS